MSVSKSTSSVTATVKMKRFCVAANVLLVRKPSVSRSLGSSVILKSAWRKRNSRCYVFEYSMKSRQLLIDHFPVASERNQEKTNEGRKKDEKTES